MEIIGTGVKKKTRVCFCLLSLQCSHSDNTKKKEKRKGGVSSAASANSEVSYQVTDEMHRGLIMNLSGRFLCVLAFSLAISHTKAHVECVRTPACVKEEEK